MPQRRLAASSRGDCARPALRGYYSRTPPPSIGKWTGRISTYGCRAPTTRRRPPRPESISARRRQTLVGRGRGSALSPPSPGARGSSGSRWDRTAWRSGAAGRRCWGLRLGAAEYVYERPCQAPRGRTERTADCLGGSRPVALMLIRAVAAGIRTSLQSERAEYARGESRVLSENASTWASVAFARSAVPSIATKVLLGD